MTRHTPSLQKSRTPHRAGRDVLVGALRASRTKQVRQRAGYQTFRRSKPGLRDAAA